VWHHVNHAVARLPAEKALVYVGSRLALALFYGIAIAAVSVLEGQQVHLHHWFTMHLAAW